MRVGLYALGLTAALASLGSIVSTPLAVQDDACVNVIRFLLPDSRATPEQRAEARKCVNEIDSIRRATARRLVGGEFLRLAMLHAMIPEYNDEQRLPTETGFLGPKAGIYASPNLGDFTEEWQFIEHGNIGVLVAHVVVQSLAGETFPRSYQDLGLMEGLNCVWLIARPGPVWTANVRPAKSDGTCAPDNSPAGFTPPTLTVQPSSAAGAIDRNYPAVARFGESAVGAPLLGVKCLQAWCEIGAGSFQTRRPLPPTFGASGIRAVVKGWHDEQMLSVRDPATNRFVPEIRAALVPMENVASLAPVRFQSWQPVAELYLERDPRPNSKYDRWGLRRGKNLIELRWVGGPDWAVRMTPPPVAGNPRPVTPRPWTFVEREVHHDAGVPGTARFRWTILDDGIWTPCGQACCEVEG